MFITKEQVLTMTGYDVDATLLAQAQSIIEVYVGKVEAEVDDATDLALLGKATAYQAAYMKNDGARVFEQAAVTQIGQFGQLVSFNSATDAPFIAPLAAISCRRLTWRRSRSVRTGSWFGGAPVLDRWDTA